MARREVASDYIGSFLGSVWTFVRPLVMIAVFWFVFSIGFKAKPMNDVPFVVWLTAGIAPWFVFADIINGATTSIVNNANLIKKTVFQSQILPVVKIVSCLMTHSGFPVHPAGADPASAYGVQPVFPAVSLLSVRVFACSRWASPGSSRRCTCSCAMSVSWSGSFSRSASG